MLETVGYSDVFRHDQVTGVPAGTWARKVLEGGPPLPRRVFGAVVWHGLMGLELSPDAATVAGWAVVSEAPDRIELACSGRPVEGRMVFAVEGSTLTWTTALAHRDRRSRAVWAVLQHVHRAMVPRLLARTGAALS